MDQTKCDLLPVQDSPFPFPNRKGKINQKNMYIISLTSEYNIVMTWILYSLLIHLIG